MDEISYATLPLALLVLLLLGVVIFLLWPCQRRRKKALQALQCSEHRFQALLEAISDALVAVDEQGRIVIFNPAAEALFGHAREQMIGRLLDSLLPERFRERHRQAIGRVFAEGKNDQAIGQLLELPALRSDGTEIAVELTLSLLVEEDSRTVLAAIRDISQRKRDEDALRLSEQRFREMADLLPLSIFETDRNGVVTFANRRAFELVGSNPDNMTQRRSILDRLSPEDRSRATANMVRILAGETLPDEEYTLCCVDGSLLSILVAREAICRDGEIVGMRGVAVNITERLRTERLLREASEKFKQLFQKYQALLDNIPDAITLLAPDLTVIRSNMGAARMLGLPVTSLPGKHCRDLWCGCSLTEENCPVKKAFKTGKVEKNTIKTADGRSWRVRAFPVVDQGKTVQVIAHNQDVTRQLQMEQEATRANHLASLGELAAGVAHEINNPINGIINYAQVLADDSGINAENREILHCIIEEGDRISNIVSSLLTFARARKEIKMAISLDDVLAATLPLAAAQLRKDYIDLRVEIDPGLPQVLAHTQQIQQVILNLVSNARYALNERYPERHENKILHIYSELMSEGAVARVRLVFRDLGTGIPAVLLPMVMDPFYTTKPSGQGTGLGLSICHGILKDHGGALKIDSVEGRHTEVAIELPAA
jgi:two-component system NtrC family sensor kinase